MFHIRRLLDFDFSVELNSCIFFCRMTAMAYSFAFKMLSELDCVSMNKKLAEILGITLEHFNEIEAEMLMAFAFDLGVTEE